MQKPGCRSTSPSAWRLLPERAPPRTRVTGGRGPAPVIGDGFSSARRERAPLDAERSGNASVSPRAGRSGRAAASIPAGRAAMKEKAEAENPALRLTPAGSLVVA